MNLSQRLACLTGMLISLSAFSQQSEVYTHDNALYKEALELYNQEQYQAAQILFEKVKKNSDDFDTQADASYYIANAAIRTNQLGADKMMEDFFEQYPTSTRRSSAYLDVANYYFDQGKYAYALRWFDKAEGNSLSLGERDEFNFKKGYALFVTGNHDKARVYLDKVSITKKYGAQAKYYIGYMAYQGDDYNEANLYFDEIRGEEELSENLSYYQADMNFKLGKFEKAIALAKEQLPAADPQERSQLNKIIGESYFNLGEYEAAIPYLREYKGLKGKWNNTDYYQLGYAYYKQGQYDEAIDQFNKIIDGSNAVAQNAYYHLGECYLKTGAKQQALNAFRNASGMPFNETIKQDAYLNYARLSYELGNPYEPVPQVLQGYLQAYPATEHTAEIESLLVDSYITSKNYEAALEFLEKNQSLSSKTTYQKVAFYRGLELFQQGDYQQAAYYLDRSLEQQRVGTFTARALYWLAESNYRMGNTGEAEAYFKRFNTHPDAPEVDEYKWVYYNLGYTAFKQKNYDEAATWFERFTSRSSNAEKEYLKDAWLRLGDARFALSSYWPAMEAYNQAIDMGGKGADYAAYQKAISYGFVDRMDKKIETLNSFTAQFPGSTLKDDAYYELGNTFVNNNRPDDGIAAYRKLTREYPMSSFVPKAILKEGLVYYNRGENEKALERFRTLVRDYKNTEEAIQAVATAKLIYVDEGRVSEYAAWVKGLDFVEVTDAELDSATFESAERAYSENNWQAAIRNLEKYLEEFPQGMHQLKAEFYLAQAYYNNGQPQQSVSHYRRVIEAGRTEYNEQALARLAEIALDEERYTEAIPLLKRLETEADFPQNITYARSNLMKAYYRLDQYDQAIAYARKVLSEPETDDRIKSDAYVVIARSAIATGDERSAREAYARVREIATGSLAAEALYYEAYFKNKDGDYKASNEAAQKLARDYSAYKETGGKGLVLMAKNFYALNDAFQATYILENVIDNFGQYPEITTAAKEELQRIKSKESMTNSSVDPNQN
ncbi:tetratricopeptide repeat protein [Robertkochia aurantiaca]|uniref:tetratricopeptide repeat protein n=1 Tax=Robertkochia aurantiaca TaxID=2873700 RepID=UPI001CCAF7F8|nr:tetratricopeptide repeat protein [Robertkochia sp. 3YJGBD-33]